MFWSRRVGGGGFVCIRSEEEEKGVLFARVRSGGVVCVRSGGNLQIGFREGVLLCGFWAAVFCCVGFGRATCCVGVGRCLLCAVRFRVWVPGRRPVASGSGRGGFPARVLLLSVGFVVCHVSALCRSGVLFSVEVRRRSLLQVRLLACRCGSFVCCWLACLMLVGVMIFGRDFQPGLVFVNFGRD